MHQNLPNELKKKRLSLKISAPDLAEILETKLPNIYKWESGMRPRNRNLSKRVDKFIDGFFDSSITNGRINFRILNELRQKEGESSVKKEDEKNSQSPTIAMELDPHTAAIVAQELTIKLLQKELDRLTSENQKLREQIEKKISI